MSILVVGSVAYDTVETPFGSTEKALGGSATYFSAAASYFAPVRIVAVVGKDFSKNKLDFLTKRNVDLRGVETKEGKTFSWGGRYGHDLNTRETLFTHLNVFENFNPVVPEEYKDSKFIFLANIAPELQMEVLNQIDSPKLVALDTMNYWIEGSLKALNETLLSIDMLLINDSEARQLAHEQNLVKAAKIIFDMGPSVVIIKKGEHGALMFAEDSVFWAPAYPLELIYDPTGAGDTFAGGFMGYLAKAGNLSQENYKHALIYGSVLASFSVEKFSLERLTDLSDEEIKERFNEFKRLTQFDQENSAF